jgi:hypothetical protein
MAPQCSKGTKMPLTRVADARTAFRRNGVSSSMKDVKNEVPCFITNHDLLSLAPNLGTDDIAMIFSAHRSALSEPRATVMTARAGTTMRL